MPIAIMFNPDPSLTAAILDDLCDPSLSLEEIGREVNCSIDALTTWMTRPDIQERLAALATAASLRARTLAALNLPAAVNTISQILRAYSTSEEFSASRDTPEAQSHRELQRVSARRAAHLLLRIARFHLELTPPAPRPSAPPHSPPGRVAAPRGGEGYVSYSISNPRASPGPANNEINRPAPDSSPISIADGADSSAECRPSPPPTAPALHAESARLHRFDTGSHIKPELFTSGIPHPTSDTPLALSTSGP